MEYQRDEGSWHGEVLAAATARQREKYVIGYVKGERTVTIVAACTILHEVRRGVRFTVPRARRTSTTHVVMIPLVIMNLIRPLIKLSVLQ